MSVISVISELMENPGYLADGPGGRGLGRAGIAGYLFGALNVYLYLRMFSSVPPGVYSFLNIAAAVLFVNFLFAACMHLFLELTACRGSAMRLFLLLGVSEFVWIALIPFGFLAKLGFLNRAVDLLLCVGAMLTVRTALVRRLYTVSANKAFLAVALPYAALALFACLSLLYGAFYMLWLMA